MIMFPLLGAAVGGLLSKKNPMQGALLGAGLGLGGGLLAPQLGAASAAEAAAGTGLAAPGAAAGQTGLTLGGGLGLSAPASAMQIPGNLAMAASGAPSQIAGQSSLLGSLDQLNKFKPVLDAAMSTRQMYGGEDQRPIVASPITPTNVSTGPNGLAQLAASNNQVGQNIQNETELRRARRLRQLAMMG